MHFLRISGAPRGPPGAPRGRQGVPRVPQGGIYALYARTFVICGAGHLLFFVHEFTYMTWIFTSFSFLNGSQYPRLGYWESFTSFSAKGAPGGAMGAPRNRLLSGEKCKARQRRSGSVSTGFPGAPRGSQGAPGGSQGAI